MTEYANVLYPPAALTIYEMVLKGEWKEWIDGNPEQAVDTIIYDWLTNHHDYDDYIRKLRNAIQENKYIAECTILRLNYAALMIEEVDEIVICTGRKSELPTYKIEEPISNQISTKRRSIINNNNIETAIMPTQNNYDLVNHEKLARDMTLSEIDQKANDFYAHREVIKQHKIGMPENKRAFIKKKIIELGFVFSEDINDVYLRLNEYLHNDQETAIIARLAYLAVINGDNLNNQLMLGMDKT